MRAGALRRAQGVLDVRVQLFRAERNVDPVEDVEGRDVALVAGVAAVVAQHDERRVRVSRQPAQLADQRDAVEVAELQIDQDQAVCGFARPVDRVLGAA